MGSELSVLFVCLGNICRSPLAEAAFRQAAARAGVAVLTDSAGTGDWHAGEAPDSRAQAVALARGMDISGYRARQVVAEDFKRFAHIIAMDSANLEALKSLRPRRGRAAVSLMLDYVPGREGLNVTDPYYGDTSGFEQTWDDVSAAAQGLLARLTAKSG